MVDTLSNTTVAPSIQTKPSVDVGSYMSPYTDDVLGSALKTLNDTATNRRNQLGTAAFQSGAFGDARHGIEDGKITDDLMKQATDITAGVKSDAFDKAMGWMNTDIDRQLGVDTTNANLDNTWFQNQLAAMGLGEQFRQNDITNNQQLADALLGLDQYDRNWQQQIDNTNYADWIEQRDWDKTNLTQLIQLLSGTPGATPPSTSPSPDNSWASMPASALSGLGGSGGGLFGN